jgi:hypothetical protein
MQRIVLTILLSFFSALAFGQSTAYAQATASIVDPIAVMDVPDANSPVQLSAYTSFPKGGTKNVISNKSVALACFKMIGGGNNLFSFSLASESVRLENSKDKATGFWVTELQVSPTTTEKAAQFVLNGKPYLTKQLAPGRYSNATPLDITIYFE